MSPERRLTASAFRVLLVEDDIRLARLIQEYLQQHDLDVAIEHRGDRVAARVRREQPDLIVLDLMLPGRDGFDVCRDIRPEFSGPILMLTARDEDIDQVVGLELGADDYVTKPVQPRVLLARLRALMRRFTLSGTATGAAIKPGAGGSLEFGALKIDPQSREVFWRGEAVEMTTSEFDLLWVLASHAGGVLSRDILLQTLRGIGYDGLDRSVDIGVSRLRRKLGDDATHPQRIKTVRGRGYLFVPDAWG